MTVPDFWDHYYMARQRVADQRFWMLRASRHAQVDVKDARRNIEDALSYAISFSRRKAAWEVGEPEMRVIQIGGELTLKTAEQFRELNPGAIEWLRSQGCDEPEAMRRFGDWLEQVRKHGFWRQSTAAKRRPVKRTIKLRHGGDIQNHDRGSGTPGAGAGDGHGSAAEPCPSGE